MSAVAKNVAYNVTVKTSAKTEQTINRAKIEAAKTAVAKYLPKK